MVEQKLQKNRNLEIRNKNHPVAVPSQFHKKTREEACFPTPTSTSTSPMYNDYKKYYTEMGFFREENEMRQGEDGTFVPRTMCYSRIGSCDKKEEEKTGAL